MKYANEHEHEHEHEHKHEHTIHHIGSHDIRCEHETGRTRACNAPAGNAAWSLDLYVIVLPGQRYMCIQVTRHTVANVRATSHTLLHNVLAYPGSVMLLPLSISTHHPTP